jgi:anaerobic magnesium-protoporphyrin IX monomethyl ester cyclase
MMTQWTKLDEEYADRIKIAHDMSERILMAKEKECPLWLLKAFCEVENVSDVAEEACLNPKTPDEYIDIAIARFPEISNDVFWELRKRRLNAHSKMLEVAELEKKAGLTMSGDRDQIILNHIREKDKLNESIDHANSHLGKFQIRKNIEFANPFIEWKETDKFRMAMIIAPAWGVLFPPYNIAKLTGLLRSQDYSVKVYDINLEAYHYFLKNHGEDYWRSERYFLWTEKNNFSKYILPDLQPILIKVVDEILESNVKVVGFSIYDTNRYATFYMAKRLRALDPDICILAGGPDTINNQFQIENKSNNYFNYIFIGEAEEKLLNLLENLPTSYPMNEIVGSLKSRLNLDLFAYPDYTDYDLSAYLHPDGVSIETSRGCVALCSFCAETHFWKFRSTTPERVVEEMEYQINKHGVKRFWFVDSLVNGNLKNFERLIDLIIEKKLKISWNSYARCDGRMDKEFFRKIVASGCTALSYGVESGSQAVLDDMRKKIQIWEIESNLKDSAAMGLYNHVNWLVAFPTETPLDFFHTLQLTFNCRNDISAISPGFGAGISPNSDLDTNWKLYSIQWKEVPWDNTFLGTWFTKDYENTNLHKFLRVKLFHIWLDIMKKKTDCLMINTQRFPTIDDFYNFECSTDTFQNYIEQDIFVNFYQKENITLSGKIINEYFPFLYGIYRYYGPCSFHFICDPLKDLNTFGDFLCNNYASEVNFEVDTNGDYSLYIEHKFDHGTNSPSKEQMLLKEKEREDMSFIEKFIDNGNINNWIMLEPQVRETIHANYRKK